MKTTPFLSLAAALLLPLAAHAQPTVDFVLTNSIVEPHSIVFGGESKFFITDSATHRVLSFDSDNGLLTLLAGVRGQSGSANGPGFLARFISPKGIVVARGGLVVADSGNHILRFLTLDDSVSVVTTLAGVVGQPGLADGPASAARFNNPVGLAADAAGNIYVADSKNNAIRKVDLNNVVSTVSTDFFEPNGIALGDNGEIFVADTKNNAIKRIGPGNVVSLLAGSSEKIVGTNDSYFAGEALFNAPTALLWVGGTTGLLVSDTGNHTIRRVYFNEIVSEFFPNLNGYSVETYGGIPRQPGFVDGPLPTAKFNSPTGLSKNSEGGLFIADLANHALRRIQTAPKLPKIKNPTVGYVIFVKDEKTGEVVSQLVPFGEAIFYNAAIIAVLAEPGTETFYTSGETPGLFGTDTIEPPNSYESSSAPPYANGSHADQVRPSILSPQPDVTLKVVSTAEGRRPSDVVQARVQFKVAAPAIVGDNPASFQISSETAEATIWYTLDGSTPTNQPPSIDVATSTLTIITNSPFTFRARAFRDGFKPSEIVTKEFSPTQFKANRISFGFERGEASSQFVASAGQRFFAPVTLSLLPSATMYSLQFNLLVTNLNAAPAVAPGNVGFSSTLIEFLPNGTNRIIPPAMFITTTNPPPTDLIFQRDGLPFADLLTTNSSINLLGVGWVERVRQTNLFNTFVQDLISYSQPHDTVFEKKNGKVVVGAYSFVVPGSAAPDDNYEITIGRATATSDGIGGPNGDVFIDLPTSGSLGGGSLNAVRNVVVGQRKYIVGDVAPFRWFNAGDFGNANLFSDDVLQVYQSAINRLNTPMVGSDLFDALDSCCNDFVAVAGAGHVLPGPNTYFLDQENPFFYGDDTLINTIAFGDGLLDVTDVYVTLRRSLDPTLTWFQRFWTNGVLAAETVPNLFRGKPNLPAEEYSNADSLADDTSVAGEPPSAIFSAPDLIVSAGQALEIPVTARIAGKYPARMCLVNLNVEPLDGSPLIAESIEFIPNPNLGLPSLTSSRGQANYGAAWLDRAVTGLKGETQLGYLRVKLPAGLPPSAAYRVRFEHISASPNGLATFPQVVQDGLLLVSARDNSSFSDAIPDSWRLRHFGSVANLLSHASADADGDGVPNQAEYKAGTNPVDAHSNIRMQAKHQTSDRRGLVLRWPTARGKTYAIEAASSMTSREWTPIAPDVIGTGFDMEFETAPGGSSQQFYRVRLVE